jgi:hypothetical protein
MTLSSSANNVDTVTDTDTKVDVARPDEHTILSGKNMDSETTFHPSRIEEGLTEKSELHTESGILPWHRRDGWAGWGREDVSTIALVPSLVFQALSAGVLDAITYADFSTFASNREWQRAFNPLPLEARCFRC